MIRVFNVSVNLIHFNIFEKRPELNLLQYYCCCTAVARIDRGESLHLPLNDKE